MHVNRIRTGILVIGALFALGANAANIEKIQLNGKPFQLLNETIQENSVAITELGGRISVIEGRVSTLESDVAALKLDVVSLGDRITTNTNGIRDVLNTVQSVSSDLDALALQHAADYAKFETEITALKGRITDLELALPALQAELQAELDSLAGDLTELDETVSAQVSALATQIETINGTIEEANQLLAALSSSQDVLADEISGLKVRSDALEGRVTTLESYHGIRKCDTGNDPGTASPYVVCEADENQAWISADNIGKYHAELICQEAGYRTVSVWSGTCGNVCGYCQGTTSCENPGAGPEIAGRLWSAYNGGTDELGPMIHRTVQWRCVK